MLPNMAAGLGSIIFSMPIDADYLNTASRAVDVPAPAITPPIVPKSSFSSVSHTLSGTPTPAIFNPSVRSRAAVAADDPDDEVVAIATKEKKKKRKKKSPYVSPRSTSPFRPTSTTPDPEVNYQLSKEPEKEEVGGANRLDIGSLGTNLIESHSSSSSRLSLNSTNEEGHNPMFVALDTRDNVLEAQAAADSMAALLLVTDNQLGGVAGGVVSLSASGKESGGMSLEEMREAMLALVKSKDNLEERNRCVRKRSELVVMCALHHVIGFV